jgi:hypothetical protein
MNLLDELDEVIKEGSYRTLRTEPDLEGNVLNHADTKSILKLSDDTAELYKERFDAGVEIVGGVS